MAFGREPGGSGAKSFFDIRQAPQNRLALHAASPRMPDILIEPAFSARLSLKGDGREEVGSTGMGAWHFHERIVLAGSIPEDERPVSRMR